MHQMRSTFAVRGPQTDGILDSPRWRDLERHPCRPAPVYRHRRAGLGLGLGALHTPRRRPPTRPLPHLRGWGAHLLTETLLPSPQECRGRGCLQTSALSSGPHGMPVTLFPAVVLPGSEVPAPGTSPVPGPAAARALQSCPSGTGELTPGARLSLQGAHAPFFPLHRRGTQVQRGTAVLPRPHSRGGQTRTCHLL